MTEGPDDRQSDIDEHLPVTRAELRRVVQQLEYVNQQSLLVALKVSNNDGSWRENLESLKATWLKINGLLDGAQHD